jgi:glycyl-tRNA synthetase beta subunit
MKITKDEARILAAALEDAKYIMTNDRNLALINKLDQLQNKLEDFGKDKRRTGRTSQDDFTDCLKRYVNSFT